MLFHSSHKNGAQFSGTPSRMIMIAIFFSALVKEGDDMAAAEKRDKVATEKKKDGAEKADGPKPKDAEHKAGEQRQVTTKAPVKPTTKPTTPVVVTTAGPATTGKKNSSIPSYVIDLFESSKY